MILVCLVQLLCIELHIRHINTATIPWQTCSEVFIYSFRFSTQNRLLFDYFYFSLLLCLNILSTICYSIYKIAFVPTYFFFLIVKKLICLVNFFGEKQVNSSEALLSNYFCRKVINCDLQMRLQSARITEKSSFVRGHAESRSCLIYNDRSFRMLQPTNPVCSYSFPPQT